MDTPRRSRPPAPGTRLRDHKIPTPLEHQWRAVLMLFPLLLGLTAWTASQHGLMPTSPGRFAAVAYHSITGLLWPIGPMWLAAAGLGFPFRRLCLKNCRFAGVVQTGLGMGVLMFTLWLLGWAGLLNLVGFIAVIAAGVALLTVQAWSARHRLAQMTLENLPAPPMATVLTAPPIALLLVACACPPGTLWQVEAFGYDVTSYHMQLPRQWLALGAVRGLEHNVYSYLPSLVEVAFTGIAAGKGSALDAVYATQLLHASLATCAALALACVVASFTTASAGAVAAAMFLATPWTLITGSLAYNEMAAIAFAATALLLAFDPVSERFRGAAVIGLLCGLATLAKLTAGVMLAVPIGLMLLLRLNHALRWRQPPAFVVALRSAAVAALFGFLVLLPFFVRNYSWTGNPVFPIAANTLGRGHWSADLVERWNSVHHADRGFDERVDMLTREWVFSAGFGTVGGTPGRREATDVARFDRDGGLPVLWCTVLVAMALALTWPVGRRASAALLLVLLVQLVFWLTATHQPGRYLVPSLLPTVAIVGLGIGRLEQLTTRSGRGKWLLLVMMIAPPVTLTLAGMNELLSQTIAHSQGVRIYHVIDAFDPRERIGPEADAGSLMSSHPINGLPIMSRTLLVGDVSGLLYLQRPVIYNTANDASVLGRLLAEEADDAAVTRRLRDMGVTHVWMGWSEIDRLRASVGLEPSMSNGRLRQLPANGRWRVTANLGSATLFELP